YVAVVFGTLLAVWVGTGVILRYTVKGFAPELLIEIPPYRRPHLRVVLEKLGLRVCGFLREAAPVILGAVVIVNLAYFLGLFEVVASFASPLVTRAWGLPKEAVTAVIIGFLRKDVAVAMLSALSLSGRQATVASTVLAMFFPCMATFAVLWKELGVKDCMKAAAIMFGVATVVGMLLNLALPR
ncbi:MAG: ferrous iron transporter B, partial [Kiritimatiellae bacterium]|nr:ferrous iron transporter B [Kiritimatiellia bacterium]